MGCRNDGLPNNLTGNSIGLVADAERTEDVANETSAGDKLCVRILAQRIRPFTDAIEDQPIC